MWFLGFLFIVRSIELKKDNRFDYDDITVPERSGIFREKPDAGDIRMALNDMQITVNSEENDVDSFRSAAIESITKNARLDEQRDKLARYLETDAIYSLTSFDLWKRIRDYILEHWAELCPDGYLSLPLTIRYNFCLYIVMMIPAEVIFPIPAFYTFLIPEQARRVPIVRDLLEELNRFFAFVKKESKKQFLVSFYIGKGGNPRDDLDFLLDIPKLISTDPIKILRWFLSFEVRADGYKPAQASS